MLSLKILIFFSLLLLTYEISEILNLRQLEFSLAIKLKDAENFVSLLQGKNKSGTFIR